MLSSLPINQALFINFFDLFRDHAEWLVDVLLPQGERSQTKRCLSVSQFVLLPTDRDIYNVNVTYVEYIQYNVLYTERFLAF